MDASIMDLLLDPQNPRLPEELIGADQPVLFQHLIEHGVLEELIESMLDNGFFEHEALIALPPDANGKQVVVEGNRRLAALMLIQRHPVITEATAIVEASDEQRRALARVPIIEVADRQEVDRFLGYRHIS